jgi:hypothetical protein
MPMLICYYLTDSSFFCYFNQSNHAKIKGLNSNEASDGKPDAPEVSDVLE